MRRLLEIRPLDSARRSATRYVPALLFTRVLSLLRLFIVANLLAGARTPEFGRYNLALELINWCVPILMLGLGDVAERYAASFARHGRLGTLIRRHARRLGLIGFPAAALFMLVSPFAGQLILRDTSLSRWGASAILSLVAVNALALVWYQYTAMLLRGLRAYTASATMETCAAILLLAFSIAAALAPAQNAALLLAAYALSNILPAILFGVSIRRFIQSPPDLPPAQLAQNAAENTTVLQYGSAEPSHPKSFAAFALLRLLLTMTFGLLALWSVQYLCPPENILSRVAHFSLPYRIAQFLGFAGITLWSSAYAVAAGAWATGDPFRARAILFKIGGLGGTALISAGLLILACKPVILFFIKDQAYHPGLSVYLSPALAMFILYALLAWTSLLGDLHERSWIGALLWGVAVGSQIALLLVFHFVLPNIPPENASLTAGGGGLLVALLCAVPFVLRVTRMQVPSQT